MKYLILLATSLYLLTSCGTSVTYDCVIESPEIIETNNYSYKVTGIIKDSAPEGYCYYHLETGNDKNTRQDYIWYKDAVGKFNIGDEVFPAFSRK